MCDRFMLAQEASGLPKGRFAARVGLTPSQLTNIARYRNPPNHEAIELASRELGLTTDWFYFGSRAGFREPRMADRLRDLESN
jgi:transcriptional regulator with XRE-family HTH domain